MEVRSGLLKTETILSDDSRRCVAQIGMEYHTLQEAEGRRQKAEMWVDEVRKRRGKHEERKGKQSGNLQNARLSAAWVFGAFVYDLGEFL